VVQADPFENFLMNRDCDLLGNCFKLGGVKPRRPARGVCTARAYDGTLVLVAVQ
jgi:hypothetical protein